MLSRKQQLYWALWIYVALVAYQFLTLREGGLIYASMGAASVPWGLSGMVAVFVGARYRFRPEKLRTVFATWTVAAVVLMALMILSAALGPPLTHA